LTFREEGVQHKRGKKNIEKNSKKNIEKNSKKNIGKKVLEKKT
jgi:hypothetical protein